MKRQRKRGENGEKSLPCEKVYVDYPDVIGTRVEDGRDCWEGGCDDGAIESGEEGCGDEGGEDGVEGWWVVLFFGGSGGRRCFWRGCLWTVDFHFDDLGHVERRWC